MLQVIDETKEGTNDTVSTGEVDTGVVKVEDKPSSVLLRIVPPHSKVSRDVVESDIDRVIEEIKVLHQICFTRVGPYAGALAMAHPQIDNKDPLRLFVTADAKIIINPKITNHTKTPVDSFEGCITFPEKPMVKVDRYHKIEVEYITIMVDPEDDKKFKLSSVIHQDLSGKNSYMFQHETDHLDAKYIYQYETK